MIRESGSQDASLFFFSIGLGIITRMLWHRLKHEARNTFCFSEFFRTFVNLSSNSRSVSLEDILLKLLLFQLREDKSRMN